MKQLRWIWIIALIGCGQGPEIKPRAVDSIKPGLPGDTLRRSAYYTTKDSVNIVSETGYTIRLGKKDFNGIIDRHPELLSEEGVYDPDLIYNCSGKDDEFGSEAGQDNYYVLYAYFLKQKNGIEKYEERRKKLTAIYSALNLLFDQIEGGGTYFGHQDARIAGYAEYSVSLFAGNEKYIAKTYHLKAQKDLYLSALRRQIQDEVSTDTLVIGKEKEKRYTTLNRFVENLDKLITDNFYLKRAEAFQYAKYEYY